MLFDTLTGNDRMLQVISDREDFVDWGAVSGVYAFAAQRSWIFVFFTVLQTFLVAVESVAEGLTAMTPVHVILDQRIFLLGSEKFGLNRRFLEPVPAATGGLALLSSAGMFDTDDGGYHGLDRGHPGAVWPGRRMMIGGTV